jgi:RecB family exonuclease
METASDPGAYLGDSLAWSQPGDRTTPALVVTSAELLAKVNRPYLSASTAKAMHSCPARMVSDRATPSGFDLFSATEKGSAAHTVLERLYQLPPGRRDKQHAMAILTEMSRETPRGDDDVDYAKAIGADPVRYNQWIAEIDASMRGIWAIEDPTAVEVHATELRLDGIEVGGVPFKGFIDRIDVLEDGGLGVVDYKGLALDTPIPTPSGWTTMAQVQVGSKVLGSTGLPITVTGKSRVHHRPCYRVTFNDGTSVVCDNVHLWQVDDNVRGGAGRAVVNADDLFELVARRKAEGHPFSVTIPNIAPLVLPEAQLPLEPYILGAWLGDGHTAGSTITVGGLDTPDMLVVLKEAWRGVVQVEDASIEDTFLNSRAAAVTMTKPFPERCGLGHDSDFGTSPRPGRADVRQCRECSRQRCAHRRTGLPFAVRGSLERWNVPLRTLLKDAGLLGNKHIPSAYLRGSVEQRLALLQGLMDTDGHWSQARGIAVFATTLPGLAEQVFELVSSLGVIANHSVGKPARKGVKTPYRVVFRPAGFSPFRLPRKAFAVQSALGTYSTARTLRRVVTSVEQVDSVATQCIEVDAPDSLYACGLGFSLSHNSGKDKSKVNKHFDDDHGDQIRLYVEALRASTGVKPRGGALLYITHGKKRRVAISDAEIRKTVRGFAQSWTDLRKAVDTQHFATSVSALCGWCPLVDSCPAAIEAGKVDRKGGAPSAAELGIGTLRHDGTLIPFRRPRPDAAELPAAAHLSVEGEPPEELEQGAHAMSANDRPWKEAKPYDGDSVDGHLSLNSYAATAVFGLASLAAEQLSTGGQKVGPAPVKALTALLATVVLEAQEVVTNGTRDFQFGANTRIRGVLRTSLDVIPLPFGGDTEAWTNWAGRTHNLIVAVAGTAIDLFDNGPALDLDFLVQTIVPAATMPVAVPAAA